MKEISIILLVLFIVTSIYRADAECNTLVDFDSIPVTATDDVPKSGDEWIYNVLNGKAGWERVNGSLMEYVRIYSPNYNTGHMGFENYGYLEISKDKSISGNSLKYVVTGGKNSLTCPNASEPTCSASGLPLNDKQTYLNYLKEGKEPVVGDMAIGNPYLYFGNNSDSNDPVPFESANDMNRLSLYVWFPAELSIGNGGYLIPPKRTISIGPYSNVPKEDVFAEDNSGEKIGGHWYHDFAINGGSWIHITVDGHPQHHNGFHNQDLYPYPSKSIRNIGSSYFENMYRFYLTTFFYEGFSIPKYSIYIDSIKFISVSEQQNNETISGLAIMFKPERKIFEISFNDKYKDNENSYSTYELRYSFEPITNSNWINAMPAHIISNEGFRTISNYEGKIEKNTPYYQSVWASFRLAPEGEKLISNGKMVYFAVKDISQVGGDGLDPITIKGGRDYRNHGNSFDYEGDRSVLKLIKSTNYIINDVKPEKVNNLRVIN